MSVSRDRITLRSILLLGALFCVVTFLLTGCTSKGADTSGADDTKTSTEETATPVVRAEDETINVTLDGQRIATVTLDQIEQYRMVDRRVVIDSSTGNETCDFSGTELSNVLAPLDVAYKRAVVVGSDGYTSDLSFEEINKENNVFLMYKNGGEPLPMLDGSPGAIRCVILGDEFGQRFTNYVVEIDLYSQEDQ